MLLAASEAITEYNHRVDAIADRVEDLSPDERMRVYLGGLPERVRAFIQTDAVYKPYENGDIPARRPATESADGYIPCSVSTVCLCFFFSSF